MKLKFLSLASALYWLLATISWLLIVHDGLAQSVVVEQRCGQEISSLSFPVGGYVWTQANNQATSNHLSSISVEAFAMQIGIPHLDKKTDENISVRDYQISSDGETIAFLEVQVGIGIKGDIPVTLNILTRGGQLYSIPADKSWRQLAPERQLGNFGLIATDANLNTIVMEVSWSKDGIQVTPVETLPLKLQEYPSWVRFINISPNWQYIAQNTGTTLNIYSVREQKIIAGIDGSQFTSHPSVSWAVSTSSNVIGHIIDGGVILQIHYDGTIDTVLDLVKLLKQEVKISRFNQNSSSQGLFAFETRPMIDDQISETSRHFIWDPRSKKLIDLCISDFTTGILWNANGEYLLLNEYDSSNLQSSTWTLVEVSSGNYKKFVYRQGILRPLAWLGE